MNKVKTLEAAIKRLEDDYDINHTYMDADDVGNLLSTIAELKQMKAEYSNYIDEPVELQKLLRAVDKQLDIDNKQFERDHSADVSKFSILIAGEHIQLYLGGPQADGLHALIGHIASENGYDVDFKKLTVTE